MGVLSKTRSEIERRIRENDLAGLLRLTALIHGHYCVGSALGVIASTYAMRKLNVEENTGMERLIAIVETNNCFSDGVQMVTGCSFGNNSLVYKDYGKTALSLVRRSGEGVRLSTRPDLGDLLKDKNPETQGLYWRSVNQRNTSPEEEARMMELNERHCFHVLNIPAESIFKIEEVKVELPSYSRLLESHICEKCGEKVMETKAVRIDDRYYCADCGEAEFGQLDWSGIHIVGRGIENNPSSSQRLNPTIYRTVTDK
jgi:formylmethanofuran dehydrogenase subunit E